VEGEEANRPMKVLLSRWQFGVTITYHFLFVPLTIGLALLVAVMQVLAYVKKDETWERLSRFFGVLFLINFAMGVVTGIVQEFQFGMTGRITQCSWATSSAPRWPWRGCSRSSPSPRSSGCGCSAVTGCQRWCTRCPSAW
jgi:hypothetical protein